MADQVERYVIYFDPEDEPGEVVVRKWVWHVDRFVPEPEAFKITTQDRVAGWTPEEWYAFRIEHARLEIKRRNPGLVMVPRSEDDEPQIVEVWM
jgi:hypothetical protein